MNLRNFVGNTDGKQVLFFDLGANVGLVSWNFLLQDFKSYTVYMFEPNAGLLNEFVDSYCEKYPLEKRNGNQVEIHAKIVGTDNGYHDFLVGNKLNSTNSRVKKIIDEWEMDVDKFYPKSRKVQSIDISAFIKQVCKKFNDYCCIIKMDIEGSEWDVCEKMLDDGTFELVDYLFIEFHGPNKKERGDAMANKILSKHHLTILKEEEPGRFLDMRGVV